MRPVFLAFAALALFLGSLMMAPLTSEVADSFCPSAHVSDVCVTTPSAPLGL